MKTLVIQPFPIAILFFAVILCLSCRKESLLEEKPSSNLTVPSTLQDLQAMLDLTDRMNQTPAAGDASADNYYMRNEYFPTRSISAQSIYIWASDPWGGLSTVRDWDVSYTTIFYANSVIEYLKKINVTDQNRRNWEDILGQAFFFRANAFYNTAQLFAQPYDSATEKSDLGIPIRLTSDFNEKTSRTSVATTYSQIIADLNGAIDNLRNTIVPNNKNRPCRASAFGLLARVYTSMRKYDQAGIAADSCLKLYNTLTDYNTIKSSTTKYSPYTQLNNAEVLFNSYPLSAGGAGADILLFLGGNTDQMGVDTLLYKSYASNDLRKSIFYFVYTSNGMASMNGDYSGTSQFFSGIATNEMYLIRAEAAARAGKTMAAMADLNFLLQKRWKTGTFSPLVAATSATAVNLVLAERRKELPFTSIRWTDLRRLNKEGANIVLTRNISGQIYTLPANDPKYTFPIPDNVIRLTGIQQNPR